MSGSTARLELRSVRKGFPGVLALDDADLTLAPGEIHALLGENGAGKSTLINIVAGAIRPDAGEMLLDGEAVQPHTPLDALRLGVGVVHQERNLIPTFTVGENVLLERTITRSVGLVDQRRIHAAAEPYLQQVGLSVPPDRSVERLSAAEQQLVEIARALATETRVLMLDEPTASISADGAARLFEILRELRGEGVSLLYVSHKLEEIEQICDRVTVLRDGKVVAPARSVESVSQDELVESMVGRTHTLEALPPRRAVVRDPILRVTDLTSAASTTGTSFSLARGEILGWYGLVGSGRTELARAVIGADRSAGEVEVDGEVARIKSPADALKQWRIGYLSEDRQHEGLFLEHSVRRNIAATTWGEMRTRAGLFDAKAERELSRKFRESLAIKSSGDQMPVAGLSGGNRQKVSLAKWLAAELDILFIDEPTVGIDIETKYNIHRLIFDLAEEGLSLVVISSDMPEIVRLADRILVFGRGRIVGDLENTRDLDAMGREIMSRIVGPMGKSGLVGSRD